MGRKKVAEVEASGRMDIRVRIDVEMERRIRILARQEGNSVAAFVRAAVVKEMNRREREDVG